jgi:hypothetical protein
MFDRYKFTPSSSKVGIHRRPFYAIIHTRFILAAYNKNINNQILYSAIIGDEL